MDQATDLLSSLIESQGNVLPSLPNSDNTTPEVTMEYESTSRYRKRSRSTDKRSSRRDRSGSRKRDRSERRSRDRRGGRSRERWERSRERRSSTDRRRRDRSITPIHLKRSRLSNWDTIPPGYEGMTVAEVKATGDFQAPGYPSRAQPEQGNRRKRYSRHSSELDENFTPIHIAPYRMAAPPPPPQIFEEPPVPEPPKPAPVEIPPTIEPPAEPEKPAEPVIPKSSLRIYVGNVPNTCTSDILLRFISDTFRDLKIVTDDGDAAVSANLNLDKAYAFVEFRTPKEATAALNLDGLTFQGAILKMRRPKDYKPPENEEEEKPERIYIPGVVSTNVEDTPSKVFIGGIPSYLNEEQVMDLLKAFGELKSFNLIRDSNTGTSKGFAFCEFRDVEAAEVACQGLNGMELGDKKLQVQKAIQGAGNNKTAPTVTNDATSTVPAPIIRAQNNFNRTSAMSSVLPSSLLASASGERTPSNVLLLMNLCSNEEAENHQIVQELKLEIEKELSKYGPIYSVNVVNSIIGGKGFIHFESMDNCVEAFKASGGRTFDGRIIVATFFPEDWYLSGVFEFD